MLYIEKVAAWQCPGFTECEVCKEPFKELEIIYMVEKVVCIRRAYCKKCFPERDWVK